LEAVTRLPDRLEVVGLPAGYAARRAEEQEEDEGCEAHSMGSGGSVLGLRGDAAMHRASEALGSSPEEGILSGAIPLGRCGVEAAEVEPGEVRSGGRSTYDLRSASSYTSDEPLRRAP
jgi:hypothetical protein